MAATLSSSLVLRPIPVLPFPPRPAVIPASQMREPRLIAKCPAPGLRVRCNWGCAACGPRVWEGWLAQPHNPASNPCPFFPSPGSPHKSGSPVHLRVLGRGQSCPLSLASPLQIIHSIQALSSQLKHLLSLPTRLEAQNPQHSLQFTAEPSSSRHCPRPSLHPLCLDLCEPAWHFQLSHGRSASPAAWKALPLAKTSPILL